MQKLDMKTPDITIQNIEKIAALFPNCLTETKDEKGNIVKAINFDLLRQELSDSIVEGPKERYQMTWPGKREALVQANTPIDKTLRPCREESVDFDTTKNLYIEGDNLEALKLLQESYLGKVKMIYIDPPYNTGNDFVYKDNFKRSEEEELEASGQIDEEGGKLVANKESNGRFHSDWMTMLYPRLKIARNLLKDDGIIFISIDDYEANNLQSICEEVFGEKNFIGLFPAIMNLKGNQDAYGFAGTHEYIAVCTKEKDICQINKFPIDEEELFKEWSEDDYGLYKKADTLRRTGQDASRTRRPKGWFPVFITPNDNVYATLDDLPKSPDDIVLYPINEDGDELSWSWGKNKINNEPYNLIVINGRNGKNIYKKQRPQLGDLPTKKPKSFLYKAEYSTSTATTHLKNLMGKKLFDGPKPVPLISDLIYLGTDESTESIILDFFSGSATTAHATMLQNIENSDNRKFIMVQLPELTDEKSEAFKAGYKTIAEIGKERIRRAGNKIKEDNKDKKGIENLDIGFRVLKIDSSNMKDVYYTPDDIDQSQIPELRDNIKDERTPEDLLFQVLLDWGVDLTLPIEKKEILGKEIYFVDDNALVACFEDSIDEKLVTEIAKMEDILKVVFKDSSFSSDDMRINVEQIFKQYSPDTQLKVI